MSSLFSSSSVTVIVHVAVLLFAVAVIVATPFAIPFTTPFASTVATLVLLLDHVTLSSVFTVAFNVIVSPFFIVAVVLSNDIVVLVTVEEYTPKS